MSISLLYDVPSKEQTIVKPEHVKAMLDQGLIYFGGAVDPGMNMQIACVQRNVHTGQELIVSNIIIVGLNVEPEHSSSKFAEIARQQQLVYCVSILCLCFITINIAKFFKIETIFLKNYCANCDFNWFRPDH